MQTLLASLNLTRYVTIGYIAAPYLVWLRYGELAFKMVWDRDMLLATTLISVRRLLASQRPILKPLRVAIVAADTVQFLNQAT